MLLTAAKDLGDNVRCLEQIPSAAKTKEKKLFNLGKCCFHTCHCYHPPTLFTLFQALLQIVKRHTRQITENIK